MSQALIDQKVASILEARRAASRAFGRELFSDPAWDIMVELLAADLRGARLKVSDVRTIAPKSTLHRWVTALRDRGLVKSCPDAEDLADPWIELAPESGAKLREILDQIVC
jgi:hypothetical protein